MRDQRESGATLRSRAAFALGPLRESFTPFILSPPHFSAQQTHADLHGAIVALRGH